MEMKEPILFCDGASGQYIPQRFANEVKRDAISGIDLADLDYLAEGPDQEWYWDTWITVCDNAAVTDTDGTVYHLYQNGDLWLLPDGYDGPIIED
jgi:hypothetical protein